MRARSDRDPYQVEHDVLQASIRSGNPINEAEYGAKSTMTSDPWPPGHLLGQDRQVGRCPESDLAADPGRSEVHVRRHAAGPARRQRLLSRRGPRRHAGRLRGFRPFCSSNPRSRKCPWVFSSADHFTGGTEDARDKKNNPTAALSLIRWGRREASRTHHPSKSHCLRPSASSAPPCETSHFPRQIALCSTCPGH